MSDAPRIGALPHVERHGAVAVRIGAVEAFERMLIDNTMRRHRGSIVNVMDELCLPRRTLNEKMAKYGLQRSDYL